MATKSVALEWTGTLAQVEIIQKYLDDGYAFSGSCDWHQGALVFLEKYTPPCNAGTSCAAKKEVKAKVEDKDTFSLKDVVTAAVDELTVKDAPKKPRGRPKKVKSEDVTPVAVDLAVDSVSTLDIPGTL